jgi:hypothetical protein
VHDIGRLRQVLTKTGGGVAPIVGNEAVALRAIKHGLDEPDSAQIHSLLWKKD